MIADTERIPLSGEVETLVAEASAEIARFDAQVGSDIAPFTSILLRSESAASSKIENLTASAKAIALAELGDSGRQNASLIVSNTRAMQAAIDLADCLDEQAIITMHDALLNSTRPEWCGHWRDEQVWIGGSDYGPFNALYVAPHHDNVPAAMADLVRFVQRDDLPPLTQAVIAHAQLETIHPFPDGNGRVGRSLIHAILRSKNLTRKITVPVSAGLLTGIDRYFHALKAYQLGDPNPLVHHLADASFAAIGNGRQLVEDLHRVRDRWDEVMSVRSDASARRIADVLLRQPVINSTLVSSELGDVPASTALRGIGALVDAGVLKKISGSSRYQRWAAAEVLTCLDDFSERAGRRGRPSRARTNAPAVRASEPLEPAAGVSDSTQVSTPPPHRIDRSQTQPSLSAPIRPPAPQEEPAAPAERYEPPVPDFPEERQPGRGFHM